jgi:hypothetical protein
MNPLIRNLMPLVMLCSCGGAELSDPELEMPNGPEAHKSPATRSPNPEPTTALHLDRPVTERACPPDRSQQCAGGCFSSDVDCASQVSCGDAMFACPSGQHAICPSGACSQDLPGWLRGDWRYEDAQTIAADRRVSFWPDHYTWWRGNNHEVAGVLTLVEGTMAFVGGPLDHASIALGSAFSASCRLLELDGYRLWSGYEVAGCPWATRIAASDCSSVGTYTRRYDTGALDALGDGSVTKHVESITLERDGFFLHQDLMHTRSCMSGVCVESDSHAAAVPGAWDAMRGADGLSLAVLQSEWKFEPSTMSCP